MDYDYSSIARLYREESGKTMEDAVAVIRRTVKLHGPRLVQEEIEKIQPYKPVDRGTYRRNFKFEDVPNGATVYNFAPHAAVVEWGRRPGQKAPPIAVIAEWVRRKGLVGGKPGKGNPSAIRQAAFLIARAIRRRGIPGHHVLALAARRLDPIVQAALAGKGA